MSSIPRLYTEAALSDGIRFSLPQALAHRLLAVRRAAVGDVVRLFNERDGEWEAEIAEIGKRDVKMLVTGLRRAPEPEPGPWLLFAPVKRLRLDLIVEKATELGAGLLQPVFTRRTVPARVNDERLRAIAISAAEQCGRLTLPELWPPVELDALLASWPAERRLVLLDESGKGPPIAEALAGLPPAPMALLAGPEGGFTDSELDSIRALAFSVPVALGPRILRAETALIAALACIQALCGDWQSRRPAEK